MASRPSTRSFYIKFQGGITRAPVCFVYDTHRSWRGPWRLTDCLAWSRKRGIRCLARMLCLRQTTLAACCLAGIRRPRRGWMRVDPALLMCSALRYIRTAMSFAIVVQRTRARGPMRTASQRRCLRQDGHAPPGPRTDPDLAGSDRHNELDDWVRCRDTAVQRTTDS